MLLAVVLACEVAFWIFLFTGLAVRYLLRRQRLGGVVLACVPVIDLVLFVVTALRLAGGATPDIADGIAAIYIGVSVGFGPHIIRRMDARFAHRYAGGPPPPPPPKSGAEHIRHEWRGLGRMAVAWAVTCALLLAGTALVGLDRSHALLAWAARMTMALGIWFLVTLSYQIWPKRPT